MQRIDGVRTRLCLAVEPWRTRAARAHPLSSLLEVLTKALDVAVGDEAGCEAEEGFVDVVASFPSNAETSEAVEPGDRALDNPAMNPEAGAVRYSAAGDDWFDALRPDQAAVLVVVIAAVPKQDVRPSTWPSHEPWDRRDLGEQGHQLGDVVTVSAGQGHRERDALAVDEDVVLAARPRAVDRAGAAFGSRRAARTWEESITARDQSSCFAARSLASSTT